jgi:hypothetical protein
MRPSLFTAGDEADANASRRNVQSKLEKDGQKFLAFTELPYRQFSRLISCSHSFTSTNKGTEIPKAAMIGAGRNDFSL